MIAWPDGWWWRDTLVAVPEGRPSIPRPLQRRVLVEAGHRCAIPTCHTWPVEIAHIVPWAEIREHAFDNLIALCPTCHVRYDRGEIDRLSMLQYKANLTVLNSRYSETPHVIDRFGSHFTRSNRTARSARHGMRADLASVCPELVDQWHPTKNGAITSSDVRITSRLKVWWRCVQCGGEWQTSVESRMRGNDCVPCRSVR